MINYQEVLKSHEKILGKTFNKEKTSLDKLKEYSEEDKRKSYAKKLMNTILNTDSAYLFSLEDLKIIQQNGFKQLKDKSTSTKKLFKSIDESFYNLIYSSYCYIFENDEKIVEIYMLKTSVTLSLWAGNGTEQKYRMLLKSVFFKKNETIDNELTKIYVYKNTTLTNNVKSLFSCSGLNEFIQELESVVRFQNSTFTIETKGKNIILTYTKDGILLSESNIKEDMESISIFIDNKKCKLNYIIDLIPRIKDIECQKLNDYRVYLTEDEINFIKMAVYS